MSVRLETGLMGKKRGRPKTTTEDNVAIKIARPLASMVKAMADRRGVGAADVLSELAQAPIERAYRAMLLELDKGQK